MFYYIIFFSILQNMLEEWRKRDRTNLTETLNSQEGAGGTEEDKYVLLHYFFFNPPKSVGGMEGVGQNEFDRDSKFSGGSRRNGGRQVRFITLICFISNLQNLLEEWRNRDRKI